MRRVREHLTYANVMVTVLAFVVLGGTAWAVAQNSIGPKQLKKSAVHTSDIADGAVTSAKVKEGTLEGGDFAAGVLPGDAVVRTTTQTIAMSCQESSPIAGTYFVNCTGQATITAPCDPGEHATGGGYTTPTPSTSAPFSSAAVIETRPDPSSGTPTAWLVKANASGGNTSTSPNPPRPPDPQVSVYAVCSA